MDGKEITITISTRRMSREIALRANGERYEMRPLGWSNWRDGDELINPLSYDQLDEVHRELRPAVGA